jgi:TRAP-type C4-dicarboxylate transport system substrate-binding protein
MKIVKIILLFILSVLILTGSVYSLTIRIGSIALPMSPWERSLEKLGSEWEKITLGKVKIEILSGELIDSEYDMIQKMRKGELGGAAFFGAGLQNICHEVYLFGIPLFVTSQEEHDYVFNKMKPVFEKKFQEKGIKVITWSMSGWIRLFSKHPVFYPGDLQEHKLCSDILDVDLDQVWRDFGFHVVPTYFKDLKMALESGMVDAFLLSPLVAESGQYFILAPNMCSQKVAPDYWCIVLTEETWKKVPGQYKKQMEEIAQKLAKDLYEEITGLENQAVEKMEEQDLIINKLPINAMEQWYAAVDNGLDKLKGKTQSEEIFNRIIQYRTEYREKNPQWPR